MSSPSPYFASLLESCSPSELTSISGDLQRSISSLRTELSLSCTSSYGGVKSVLLGIKEAADDHRFKPNTLERWKRISEASSANNAMPAPLNSNEVVNEANEEELHRAVTAFTSNTTDPLTVASSYIAACSGHRGSMGAVLRRCRRYCKSRVLKMVEMSRGKDKVSESFKAMQMLGMSSSSSFLKARSAGMSRISGVSEILDYIDDTLQAVNNSKEGRAWMQDNRPLVRSLVKRELRDVGLEGMEGAKDDAASSWGWKWIVQQVWKEVYEEHASEQVTKWKETFDRDGWECLKSIEPRVRCAVLPAIAALVFCVSSDDSGCVRDMCELTKWSEGVLNMERFNGKGEGRDVKAFLEAMDICQTQDGKFFRDDLVSASFHLLLSVSLSFIYL